MKLHYKIYGEGNPLFILHGLFGCGDNWGSIAKKLSSYFKVIVVDQRNHGHSAWSDEMSYSLMAFDLKELFEELKISKAIVLGHSMGGKTAMKFNEDYPALIDKLIVIDIGMKTYPPHHTHIIEGMDSVQLDSISSRKEAEIILSKSIEGDGIVKFLLKNLIWKKKGELAWRMNFEVLKNQMPKILEGLELSETNTQCLFIRGELSNYILEEDIQDIESIIPDSNFKTIKNAGHWVHAEQTEDFINEVLAFCLL